MVVFVLNGLVMLARPHVNREYPLALYMRSGYMLYGAAGLYLFRDSITLDFEPKDTVKP